MSVVTKMKVDFVDKAHNILTQQLEYRPIVGRY
jgi:hypothetical protein